MATYTITTTAAEEKGLAYIVGVRNAERAAETPPKDPLTAADYVDQILVRRSLLAFRDMMRKAEEEQVATAYSAADNATQNTVKTTLGIA